LFSRLKQEGIGQELLDGLLEGSEELPLLREKLADISRLLVWFQSYMAGKYQDADDQAAQVISRMERTPFLQGTKVWIDHFYSFTTPDIRVIEQLFRVAADVTVAFTLDMESGRDQDIFTLTRQNYDWLEGIARRQGLSPVAANLTYDRGEQNEALRYLEKGLFAAPFQAYEGPVKGLELLGAQDGEEEIERVAQRIMTDIYGGEFRFSDIAVIGFDMERYEESIRRIFTQYGVPFFIDARRNIMDTALVKLTLAVLRIFTANSRQDDVVAFLKTGLAGFTTAAGETLENYALAYGIQGFRWYRPFFLGEAEEVAAAEACREKLALILAEAFGALAKADTYGAVTRALYSGLESLNIREQLDGWIAALQGEENWEKAWEYAQIWDYLMNCLDQINEILGDSPVSLAQYANVLEAGLAGSEVGMIPVTADQVVVGTMQRSVIAPVRSLYVIGLQGNMLPGMLSSEDILAAEEQEYLLAAGLKLGRSRDELIGEESYLAYRILSRAREKICFSYPATNGAGQTGTPSLFIPQLRKVFPGLRLATYAGESSRDKLGRIFTGANGMKYLVEQLRMLMDGYEVDDAWRSVYAWYDGRAEWRGILSGAIAGLYHQNQIGKLDMQRLTGLYGEPIRSSVSRLEQFAWCPFAHFVQYGLRPRPRQEFALYAPDIGFYLHRALQEYGRAIAALGLNWEEVDPDTSAAVVRETLQVIPQDYEQAVFQSTCRNQFLESKLSRIAVASAWALTRQIAQGSFVPQTYELSFGGKGQLPALDFNLPAGDKLTVEGKIDRVDLARIEQKNYVRVIDYKSSDRGLQLSDIYHGLNIQLTLYMLAVLEGWKKKAVQPAGSFYFHMDDPWVDLSQEDDVLLGRDKRFRLRGLLVGEPQILEQMDRNLSSQTASQIIPVSRVGKPEGQASVLSAAEFAGVLGYSRNYIQKAGAEIAAGMADIRPVRTESRTACLLCDYQSVCQFDPEFPDNRYVYKAKLGKPEALQRMQAGQKKEDK
jgi:ATP-dependent helicase/nuclease subunit B